MKLEDRLKNPKPKFKISKFYYFGILIPTRFAIAPARRVSEARIIDAYTRKLSKRQFLRAIARRAIAYVHAEILMKANVYNQQGDKIDEVDLPDKVFNAVINLDLLHQAVLYYEALSRQPIAKTKDRSEVRGGGRKPWRQKGTGRARHGSIRSPIWRHGGVTFGPRPEKKYQIELPKKMRKKSLYMALSSKLKDGEIIFLDKIKLDAPKTRKIKEILNNLSKIKKDIENKKLAVILKKRDEKILKAIRNIKKLSTIPADSLNTYFLLKNKYIIMEKEAINKIL